MKYPLLFPSRDVLEPVPPKARFSFNGLYNSRDSRLYQIFFVFIPVIDCPGRHACKPIASYNCQTDIDGDGQSFNSFIAAFHFGAFTGVRKNSTFQCVNGTGFGLGCGTLIRGIPDKASPFYNNETPCAPYIGMAVAPFFLYTPIHKQGILPVRYQSSVRPNLSVSRTFLDS